MGAGDTLSVLLVNEKVVRSDSSELSAGTDRSGRHHRNRHSAVGPRAIAVANEMWAPELRSLLAGRRRDPVWFQPRSAGRAVDPASGGVRLWGRSLLGWVLEPRIFGGRGYVWKAREVSWQEPNGGAGRRARVL
jgi:hypothetical protein